MTHLPARRPIPGTCTAAGVLLAMAAVVVAQPANTPEPLKGVGIDQHLNAQLPMDLTFRDETGRTVRLGDYFDGRKPVILTLVYYECPMLCTLVLNDTVRALRAIPLDVDKDFDILTISFNPREGPELAAAKKRSYVDMYRRPGAEAGWHFLSGDEAAIRELTDRVGFHYNYDAKTGQFFHPAGITVLTPEGRISRYFFGIDYEPKDIRLSLVEASKRQIGALTDSVLLFCYHYDPSTGKYGLAVMNALRVGGVVILLAVALMWVLLSRISRRRQHAAIDGGEDNAPPVDAPEEPKRS